MANIEEKVEGLVKNKIEKLGFELYDVQYVKEGQNYFLRVFIEKPNGSIDLNDCEKVNDGINDILDTAGYIKDQYFLEVSSTGLEKILRKEEHLKQNIGTEVQVSLFKPMDLQTNEEGSEKEQGNNKANNKKENKKEKNKTSKVKEIVGKLHNFDANSIELELENSTTIKIERKNISQIKTVFDWNSLD